MDEPRKIFERFEPGDPLRERDRAQQVRLVRAYKRLALDHTARALSGQADGCDCSAWVVEMAGMVEDLHKRIDVLDPESVR